MALKGEGLVVELDQKRRQRGLGEGKRWRTDQKHKKDEEDRSVVFCINLLLRRNRQVHP